MIGTKMPGGPQAPVMATERRLRRCRVPYVAAVASLAAMAFVAPTGGGGGLVEEPIGTLSLSMVELLVDDGGGVSTSLSDVVDDVLEGDQGSAHDGTGVDVALIDSGVAPVVGLDGPNVVHGPDLSDEGAYRDVAYLDSYGHGTHMAGIIAGTRPGHEGLAPGARIVSVKVAGADGVTTVPQPRSTDESRVR